MSDPVLQPIIAAVALAHTCQAGLHLLLVVPTLGTLPGDSAAGRLLPMSTAAMLDIAQQNAEDYLRRHVSQLQGEGLAVQAEVARGDPTSIIVETAQRTRADVIVLGTHAKAVVDAFWSGSTALRVSSRARLPLLLVPVTEATRREA